MCIWFRGGSECQCTVLSPQPYSIQNYLVTVKVMTTCVGRKIQYKKINLCVVDIPGLNEEIFAHEKCSHKPPHWGYWPCDLRKVTEHDDQMESVHNEHCKGHLPWIKQC